MALVRTKFIEYYKRKICNRLIKIINQIAAYLSIYTILFLMTIIYPSQIGNQQPQNQSRYIPKRKRRILYATRVGIIGYIQRSIDIIHDKILRVKHKQKINDRKAIAKRHQSHPAKHRKWDRTTLLVSAIAMLAGHREERCTEQRNVTFDSDSESIGIDNRCLACISHKIDDFIGDPSISKRTIKGFGGTRMGNVMVGTIQWDWSDDEGKIHRFRIPKSYYVPDGGVRLMSPHH